MPPYADVAGRPWPVWHRHCPAVSPMDEHKGCVLQLNTVAHRHRHRLRADRDRYPSLGAAATLPARAARGDVSAGRTAPIHPVPALMAVVLWFVSLVCNY